LCEEQFARYAANESVLANQAFRLACLCCLGWLPFGHLMMPTLAVSSFLVALSQQQVSRERRRKSPVASQCREPAPINHARGNPARGRQGGEWQLPMPVPTFLTVGCRLGKAGMLW